MILYLSRNESAHLLDTAARENALHIRKLSGHFTLSEFIVREMRKYASCRYFCVERLAITEKDAEFLEAVKSFQMMFDARIIVIHESVSDMDGLIQELVRIGVTDIVTAADEDGKQGEIDECFTDWGMVKFKPKPKPKPKPKAKTKTVKPVVYEDEDDEGDYDY